jgi:hypothetical protein
MIDLQIDASNDLMLYDTGKTVNVANPDGSVSTRPLYDVRVFDLPNDYPASVAQRIRNYFLTFQGEWYLVREYGLPYFQQIFQKRMDAPKLKQLYENYGKRLDYLTRFEVTDVQIDREKRRANIKFKATTLTGEVVEDMIYG